MTMNFVPTLKPLSPLLTLLLISILSACGEAPIEPVAKRTVIVGFDGMDPDFARQWMDEGILPHFSALAAEGTFRPLKTSNPPQSPVAWSNFATGKKPGEHGIYDFLRRDPATHGPSFSISNTLPPENTLDLFGYTIPLDNPQLINRRQGVPFWTTVEDRGGRSTVMRVPVTYPPDPIHRMISGMGVPDLLGTQGTYTIYTTSPPTNSGDSTRHVRVRPDRTGRIETSLEGPPHPLDMSAPAMSVPLLISPASPGASITLGETELALKQNEWSDWISVEFEFMGFMSLPGMVRLFLVQDYPRIQLYVSPIHIDPMEPVIPLSSPADYATELAESIGRFHTIGMPEETWSLNELHIPDSAFLDMIEATLAEREAMFYQALDTRDSELVIGVFVQTDRVSHMFYRGIDPEHPLHDQTDARGREAIRWIYTEADRVLGNVMDKLGPNDELIVLSDHGFSPFRWGVNLNRWLVDNGYLVLKEGAQTSGGAFQNVDWSKTRAYALGLNGLYLNIKGREAYGSVEPADAAQLKAALMTQLADVKDPDRNVPLFHELFDGSRIYAGNANADAPDIVVGYTRGYRASWQTTLGGIPRELVEPNVSKWSGDHCIAPDLVPGVLFANFTADAQLDAIEDIAHYILKH